jgi:hypothetical protein
LSDQTTPLIKCVVTNRNQQSSLRLIERDSYDLWEYLVNTRHQINVSSQSHCLWVSADEFERKNAIYSRAGDNEPVCKVQVLCFDAPFTTRCRFAPAEDQAIVESLLVAHLPADVREAANFAVEREAGYAVTATSTVTLTPVTAKNP